MIHINGFLRVSIRSINLPKCLGKSITCIQINVGNYDLSRCIKLRLIKIVNVVNLLF